MAKVVLHVGAHKTGTTYLQNLFHLNRARLASGGVHYPDIGPNTAHHALAGSWITLPDIPDRFYGPRGPDGLWQDLVARYAKAPGTLFLSAENFSRCYPEEVDMADLARRLSAFEEVRVVYVLRTQSEMVQSLWLQLAKSDRLLSVYSYVRQAIERRRAVGVRIDHGTFHEVLLRGFAPEQITLLDYGRIRRAPGGIGQTFLDLLGSGVPMADLQEPPPEESNISPDPLPFWAASQIAGKRKPRGDLLQLVSEAFRRTGRPTTLLARHEYQKIASRYGAANRVLVEKVQKVQPGFTFEDPVLPENVIFREEIPPTVWIEIAAGLHAGRCPSTGRPLGERLRAGFRRLRNAD